ncbi:hypothetical protein COU95_03650 [Candidatus Shapirobacteria bacterium CG10_big_fil_rev_8_21_14_0_10_40_9]|uniref:Uncharacterized protein n=1 Tax=Candidatus Shapirobacteria bacterium CG10_big_fil_rev_8_21_14_0_10_40_9 TaxID=1974888 RepID=A0A2M8L2W2_9BACT|nr:MAG: hypothetical protein COU95_03650 [Candidatus Shapirobacteria bacterium CG10_big_fil_rev_8_21_14_0_10_40_9]
MTFDQILNFLLSIQIWTISKIIVCFALFLYIIFAVVVVRQVRLMTEAIDFSLDWFLKTVAMIHLLGAIVVLLLAIIIL